MYHIGIAFFSGTGNTWRVAQHYAAALQQHGHVADLLPIERPTDYAALDQYDLLGLGYPVYAWSRPYQVETWLRVLPYGAQDVFVFTTAGGAEGSTHLATRRCLATKGYRVCHEVAYHPDCHYHFQAAPRHFPEAEIEVRYDACRPTVEQAVGEILAGQERLHPPSLAGRLGITELIWRFYCVGCPTNRWFFRVGSACNGCGLCARLCPAGNITLIDGRPHYGPRCSACLRCVSVCPQSAIVCGPARQRGGRYLAPGYMRYLLELHPVHE